MDLAGEAIGREPFGHGIGVEERAIDFFGGGFENAMEADGRWHDEISFRGVVQVSS
jgi:hypothetical protein